ncbi:MAG: GNAT family N-acetyltransferase [Armatimonadetes bacterium]|nr:GNAT family N-acetyltransferase [Armatimonadota bacterium]
MIANDLSLEACVGATEENFWALWSNFGKGPGCALHDEQSALWFDTPLSYLPYNAVLRFRPEGDAEPLIDRIFDHYQKRGVPFAWVVHPSATPANLAELLRARGMTKAEIVPGMTMDLADLPPREPCPEGVVIREATTDEDLAQAYSLVAWRWGVPDDQQQEHRELSYSFPIGKPGSPARCWLAYMNGQAVSKALLNMDGTSAGVHGVATKDEARGKGLARTLTLEALHAGREAGYRLGVLHSSAMARSLYEKIGFRQVSEFGVYVAGADFHV